MSKVYKARADQLQLGEFVVMKITSLERTSTGYVEVWLDGKLKTVPPDTYFTVVDTF